MEPEESTFAMQRFHVLDNVKHQKPRLPEVAEDAVAPLEDVSTVSHANLKGGPRKRNVSNSVGVSAHFEQLLKQLAQQHVNELAEMRNGSSQTTFHSSGRSGDSASETTPMEQFVTPQTRTPNFSEWHKAREARAARDSKTAESGASGGTDSESLRMSPFERDVSGATQATRMARSATAMVDAIMQSRNPQLREVDADNVLSIWDDTPDSTHSPKSSLSPGFRNWCKRWLSPKHLEIFMVCILLANVLWMAIHLQVNGAALRKDETVPGYWEFTFLVGDLIFATIFAAEVCIRCCLTGWQFWRTWISYLDLVVGISSAIEIYIMLSSAESFELAKQLRSLRIVKLVKSVRMFSITSVLAPLHLLTKCLEACVGMLFWSFLLMSFVQCVAGIVVSELCYGFMRDSSNDPEARDQVYQYYGTFTRTILSMFEIMFANWGPACRVLVENVNEWFSVFFLVYRCVMGFAVLNVVSAVFVQQALKTASSDDDLAFRQKERDIAQYNRKVKKLFCSIDGSGDGAITLDEFTKLVQSPKLKFWMSQLELEYHDLLSLFEFLDNGDGQITLMEFIEGAQRLRGSAKALDIWRMETKIEVLFEEVLQLLANSNQQQLEEAAEINVANVFQKGPWRHIQATTTDRVDLSYIDEGNHDSPTASPMAKTPTNEETATA